MDKNVNLFSRANIFLKACVKMELILLDYIFNFLGHLPCSIFRAPNKICITHLAHLPYRMLNTDLKSRYHHRNRDKICGCQRRGDSR